MATPIDTERLADLLADERVQLVEVLPAEEFAEEHLPGARSLPLKSLDAGGVAGLDAARPVVVYCYDYQ
ncbi:MAG: rhodanese-like domain-containing protein [Acidimicrobiales bacterium]